MKISCKVYAAFTTFNIHNTTQIFGRLWQHGSYFPHPLLSLLFSILGCLCNRNQWGALGVCRYISRSPELIAHFHKLLTDFFFCIKGIVDLNLLRQQLHPICSFQWLGTYQLSAITKYDLLRLSPRSSMHAWILMYHDSSPQNRAKPWKAHIVRNQHKTKKLLKETGGACTVQCLSYLFLLPTPWFFALFIFILSAQRFQSSCLVKAICKVSLTIMTVVITVS